MSNHENENNLPARDDPRLRRENNGEEIPDGAGGGSDGFTWTWKSKGRGGGLVLGPLLGIPLLIIMFFVVLVLLVVGGIVFAIGGRRIAAALFRRAASAREFDFFNAQRNAGFNNRTEYSDPDVIDVEAEEVENDKD